MAVAVALCGLQGAAALSGPLALTVMTTLASSLLVPAAAASSRESGGCLSPRLPPGQEHRLPANKTVMRTLTLTDKHNFTRARRYAIHVPSGYDGTTPAPLLLYLHGQSGTAKGDIGPYTTIGDREGYITVSCAHPPHAHNLSQGGTASCASSWGRR